MFKITIEANVHKTHITSIIICSNKIPFASTTEGAIFKLKKRAKIEVVMIAYGKDYSLEGKNCKIKVPNEIHIVLFAINISVLPIKRI